MKYQVHLLAFSETNDVLREVDVPEEIPQTLENIFYFGQNDFQPVKDRYSVSVGDVVLFENKFHVVMMVGFKELTKEQYEEYINIDVDNRRRYVLRIDNAT